MTQDDPPSPGRGGSFPPSDAVARIRELEAQVAELRALESEALRQASEVRDLYENAPCGYHSLDVRGVVVRINRTELLWLGYDRDEVLGKRWVEFLSPPSQGAFYDDMDRMHHNGNLTDVEYEMVRKDGSRFPVLMNATSVRSDQGRVVVTRSTLVDITDRRRATVESEEARIAALNLVEDAVEAKAGAEAALEALRSENRQRTQAEEDLRRTGTTLQSVVDSSQTGILFEDNSGMIVFANQAFRKLFGLSQSADFKGLRACQLASSLAPLFEDAARFNEITESCRETGRPVVELALSLKDGRHLARDYVPVRSDQALLGHLWQYRDLTRQQQLEGQLRDAAKMEAIGQLAGGVAHDFNNILAAAMMHLELLLQRVDDEGEIRESLLEMQAECQRGAGLTRQLLMFSRRSVLQTKPVDLNHVISHLLKMLGRLLGEHIQIRFQPTVMLPAVEADVGMLEQVVVNLAVNARDAMPKGGRLTIRTEAVVLKDEDDPLQYPSERRPGRFIRLAVMDTGIGMDTTTVKHIFEPFFTTKAPGKGTGLGLATVYGIVRQHKGWVDVETHPGKGSEFVVFLPASDKEPENNAPATHVSPQRKQQGTIMVVEDEHAVRKVVVASLRHWGYEVVEASDAVEALHHWDMPGTRIDLLLTDMVMPASIDGIELAEQLLARKPDLKVIVLSGYSADLTGFDNPVCRGDIVYLSKPCPPSELASAIRRALDGKDGTA